MYNKCFSKIIKRLHLKCKSKKLTLHNIKRLLKKIEHSTNPSIINGEYVHIVNTSIKNGCIISIYLNNENSITLPRILFILKIINNKIEMVNSCYYMNNCDLYKKIFLEIPGAVELSNIPSDITPRALISLYVEAAADLTETSYRANVSSAIFQTEFKINADKILLTGSVNLNELSAYSFTTLGTAQQS